MRKAFIKLHLSIILAGFTGIFGKLITLNEGLLVIYRMIASGIILYLILSFAKKIQKVTSDGFLRISSVGALLGLHWIFFYGSIKYSNVSVGVICFSLTSFFTAILDPLINKRKCCIKELVLSGFAVVGIGLIFHFDIGYRTGIILGIISSLLGSLFTIVNNKLTTNFNSQTITVYQMLGGSVVILFIMPLYIYLFPVESLIPSLTDATYLILLSVFCTIGLYILLTQAQKTISPFTVSLSYNLEPVYSILLAFIIFKENKLLSVSFYLGLSLIVISVLLQTWRLYSGRRKLALQN